MPAKLPKIIPPTRIENAVDLLLENPIWLQSLDLEGAYVRVQDDCDGDLTQTLAVAFSPDGDAWVRTNGPTTLRFRSMLGGGMSLRTRNALILLAEAIRRDTAERSQLPAER